MIKKLLLILCSFGIVGTSTLGLVSCTKEKFDNEIIGNFKKLCSQNNPFHVDNEKWYFVIIKVNDKLNVIKFQNNEKPKDIYKSNEYEISLAHGSHNYSGLVLWIKKDEKKYPYTWGQDKGQYFKNVYQWLGDNEPTNNDIPKIDENGNIII